MTLFYDRFDTPIGPLTVAADAAGLRHILFARNRHDAKGRDQWQHAPDAVAEHGFNLVRVATDAQASAARDRALAHYRSQLRPLRPELTAVVPASMLDHHRQQLLLRPRSALQMAAQAVPAENLPSENNGGGK